jgi:glycoprotein endo-alpha-1,2-mannosidase
MAMRDRASGEYYRETLRRALAASTPFLSISSFNGWHEGTQIEPAVPKEIPGYAYNNYRSSNVGMYLDLTKQIVRAFSR